MQLSEAGLEGIRELLGGEKLLAPLQSAGLLHLLVLPHLQQVSHSRGIASVVVIAVVAVGTLPHLLLPLLHPAHLLHP